MTRSKSSTIIFGFFRTLLSRLISYAKTVNPEPEHIQVSSTQLASDFFFTDSFTDYGTLTLLFQDHVWAPYPFLHFSKADTKKMIHRLAVWKSRTPILCNSSLLVL